MAVRIVKVARPSPSLIAPYSLRAVLVGLWVAMAHLLRNLVGFIRGRQDFTVYFPEQRFVQPPAMRGMPVLVQMENGKERCVACGLCEWACPTTCITIFPAETADEVERYPEIFDIDMSRCMFCGLCEDACPVDALELTQDFELASYTRDGAIWDRQMLEEGPKPTQYVS